MFHLFSRLPPVYLGVRRQLLANAAAVACDAARPDFDPSDFQEPTPTIPGGYWHGSDESRDDAPKVP